MTTTIHSNGSKWMGQEPDSIETLLDILSRYVLDPRFEEYGNFIQYEPELVTGKSLKGITRFWGNFLELSHVFNIDTDDQKLITTLTAAIRANQQTKQYKQAREAA